MATYSFEHKAWQTIPCEVCGELIPQAPTGRVKRYCSAACKQEAYRKRRKPPLAREALVSGYYLERQIGMHQSAGEYAAADALRQLAAEFKIALHEDAITRAYQYYEDGKRHLAALLGNF